MAQVYKLESNLADYVSTLSQNKQEGWGYTSYYILSADNSEAVMNGTSIIITTTVDDMLVDTQDNCFVWVRMEVIDQTTNDNVASVTVELTNQSEVAVDWGVRDAKFTPGYGAKLNNVNPSSTSAGVKKEESTLLIASASVTDIEIETKGTFAPVGGVTSRGISLGTAQKILTTVMDALRTMTLNKPTEQNYTRMRFAIPESYSSQRSSDGLEVNYRGFVEPGDQVRITDSKHNFVVWAGTRASVRSFWILSGKEEWVGSSTLPTIGFDSQPQNYLSLLRDKNGVFSGLVDTQLDSRQIPPEPLVQVSDSSVTAELAGATAVDLPRIFTIQRLAKSNC